MMIAAKRLNAMSIALSENLEAVLVQVGEEWNEMRQYRCISPPAFAGQTIITAPPPQNGGVVAADGWSLHVDGRVVLMASPDLGMTLRAINEGRLF